MLDRAQRAGLDRVVVAADDPRIERVVLETGGVCVSPPGLFASGTDRIAAALPLIAEPDDDPADIIVNVQGDEPFIEPELIAGVAGVLRGDSSILMATAATAAGPGDRDNPNVVKTVLDAAGTALYFSRSAIPGRGGAEDTLRHIGIYAYRRDLVNRFVAWPAGRLEKIEGLEQLRALENGVRIRVIVRPTGSVGIDTPEDLERARNRWNAGSDSLQ